MLYQLKGACQLCSAEYSVVVHNDQILSTCPNCNENPFIIAKYKGLVYIVDNKNQVGVKIGMTEKSVEARLKSLNNTSVAGKFEPIAIWPSNRPKNDEKRVHKRLAKKKLSKEHFDLTAVEACLKCFRALNRRRPIFYRKDIEERFDLELKKAKIEFQLKIKGGAK